MWPCSHTGWAPGVIVTQGPPSSFLNASFRLFNTVWLWKLCVSASFNLAFYPLGCANASKDKLMLNFHLTSLHFPSFSDLESLNLISLGTLKFHLFFFFLKSPQSCEETQALPAFLTLTSISLPGFLTNTFRIKGKTDDKRKEGLTFIKTLLSLGACCFMLAQGRIDFFPSNSVISGAEIKNGRR